MKGTVLFLDGKGNGWKIAIFDIIKGNHPNARYINNEDNAKHICYTNFAVIDGDSVDAENIYIPTGYKIISMSINSDKTYDNCRTYHRFDSKSKPSSLLKIANEL